MNNLFGTDGIRGRANEFPLDGSTLIGLGKGLVTYLLRRYPRKRPRLVIAQDPRLSSIAIESLLVEVGVAQGAEVFRLGVLPTPAVPILCSFLGADLGLMITASHNPYWDNGVKIFNAQGLKLSEADEVELSELTLRGPCVAYRADSPKRTHVMQYLDGAKQYRQALLRSLQTGIDCSGYRVAVDSANGAASNLLGPVFEWLGVQLIAQSHAPDGTNINDQCGALYPEFLAQMVVEERAHLGFALDGDGDRCVLIDEKGSVLAGDEVLGICALDLKARGACDDVIVSTVLANVGLEMTLFENGISLVRTPVGDKNVVSEMVKRSSRLGGESSGHFIFLDHSTTGDGVLSGIQVLQVMARTRKPLSELRKAIRLLPQIMVNVPVKRKDPFSNHNEILEVISSVESALQNRGRVLVRYSGTESVARVMLEGEDKNCIRVFCDDIAATLARCLSE